MRVALLAGEQHGRLSFQQLQECGLSAKAVLVRERRGQLHRVYRGVYAVGHEAWTLHGHFMAAVLAGGEGAALSHLAAAALWGFLRWQPGAVDVIVPGDGVVHSRACMFMARAVSIRVM